MSPLADFHTHVFNVGFLPVEGFLRVHNVPKPVAAALTSVFTRLLERDWPSGSSKDADGPIAERLRFMEMLQDELIDPTEPVAFDEPDFFARFAAMTPREDIEALADVLRGVDLLVSPSARDHSDVRLGAKVLADNDDLRRCLNRLLREGDKVATPIESGEVPDFFALSGVDVRGTVKWLCMLVQHESRIAAAFARYWSNKPSFDFRVHFMMDMELHYEGRPPVYPFETEQIPRMARLAKHADTKPPLVGFVAYEPFRTEWERIIDNALSSGLTGVKFYPPNGYRPIDNAVGDIMPVPDRPTPPPPNVVNDRNLAFFRKCVAQDIPVFTHCTLVGVESRPNETGRFSNPKHWRRVLETAGLERLRLCFGHAGGQEGWLAPDSAQGNSTWTDSYANEVVELCSKYDNVYCDFGMFDGLLSSDDAAACFRYRLRAAIDRFPNKFALRCCYGTDWHLVSRKKGAKEYQQRFESILTKDLAKYRKDIMCENARRFLTRND